MEKLWYVMALAISGGVCAEEAVFDESDPLQWEQEPHARLSYSVSMRAEVVNAPGGVEYNFVCTSDKLKGSGWHAETGYEVAGLSPETEYIFVAKVRGKDSHRELLAPSRPITVRTRKADHFDQIVSDDIELVPIMINGDKDNRINIVVVNRWVKNEGNPYNRPELREEFLKHVRDVIEPAFDPENEKAVEPFASQRGFFNAYALWWPSIPPWDPRAFDKGEKAMHWTVYNEVRARLFLPWNIEGKGWVTHMAMLNSRGGGGGAGRILEERVGDAMIVGNEIQGFYHEFAHTAMGLPDKYIGWGLFGRADESGNTTLVFQRDKVKWNPWIDPETPVPTPYSKKYLNVMGLFEGGNHRAAYIFRSTPVCIMGVSQFSETLCPLCVQSASRRTYLYTNPIENPQPVREELTLKSPGRAHFSVSRIKPVPDTQKMQWRLNGKVIAENVDAVDVELGAIAEYELVYSLTDRTELIRPNPPFAQYPRAERRWRIVNPNPTSKAEALKVVLDGENPGCLGINDGYIIASISGGKPPYSYFWSNGDTGQKAENLDAGAYLVSVVDSEFRRVTAECDLERPLTLVVDARSNLENGQWQIVLDIKGDDPENVSCQWSTGAEGLVLKDVGDGKYSYAVTHKSGAVITGEATLTKPAESLQMSIQDVVASTCENNGQIRLSVEGGRKPYNIIWADNPKQGGQERYFLPPGEYVVTVRDANLTTIEETIIIRDEPPFTLERPIFKRSASGGVRIANPQKRLKYLWYTEGYPTYILRPPRGLYEGTFTTSDGRVVEADGAVIPNTNGKWVNTEGEKNKSQNDYGSWVRLDAYVSGRDALPLTVKLKTDHTGQSREKIKIFGETRESPDPYEIMAKGKWNGEANGGKLTVTGGGPAGGRFEMLYTARHESMSHPVHVGSEFHPPKAGNYFVAAQKEDIGAISYNRVGVAVSMSPAPRSQGNLMKPDQVTSSKLLLWLDAADLDGDGVEDSGQWDRGSLLGWRGKPGGWNATSFFIYEPDTLNGRPVASWQYIWLQTLEESVKNYQTIIMVYRDHELSQKGTGPWVGVPAYIWDLQNEEVPEKLQKAKVWLNGEIVNPCATPPPMEFCVATFEYESRGGNINRTETKWEGAVAEFLVYDGKLTEEERLGVQEYLQRKWTSEVHIESPRTAVETEK